MSEKATKKSTSKAGSIRIVARPLALSTTDSCNISSPWPSTVPPTSESATEPAFRMVRYSAAGACPAGITTYARDRKSVV